MSENRRPVVRVPPSPTGNLHVGTARTALFNYLFAKRMGGRVLLRIEDTDRERSRPEFEQNIIDGLAWLNIRFDSDIPLRQSERGAAYRAALERLITADKAFVSKETPDGDRARSEVIRFRNPGTRLSFRDEIRGTITFDTAELGDFVIAKSLDEPLYHLAVVVDDLESGVTHVIRGEDHISNTPRQILILEALGGMRPVYAHIPLILAPDRTKLSKRHGAVSVAEYRSAGFLPEAMVNYLALLGWNPGGESEIFTLDELGSTFDLAKVQKGGAVFDIEKLKWFNRAHLMRKSPPERARIIGEWIPDRVRALPGFNADSLQRAESIISERISTLGEVRALAEEGALDYLFARPHITAATDLLFKGSGTLSETAVHLRSVEAIVSGLPNASDAAAVKQPVMQYAEAHGRGAVLWPVRFALTGLSKSADPFSVIAILGSAESAARLADAAALADASR